MSIRIAVIGCGQWGMNLVRNFYALGALSSVADPTLSPAFTQHYPVPIKTFDAILADESIQGVAFAVPAPLHAVFGMRALTAGKHVFIEKPMALCANDVQLLIKTAHAHNRLLMGGHVIRYHPAFLALQEWISEGKLGNLLFIDAYRQTFGRICLPEKNVFWSLSPHDLSLVLALMGEDPIQVTAQADQIFSTYDQGTIHMAFSGNRRARVFASWIYPKKEQRLVVVGEKGSVIFDDTAPQKLMHYTHTFSGTTPVLSMGQAHPIPYKDAEPLKEECQHFLQSIERGTQPLTDGQESLSVTRILEAADASLLSRATIDCAVMQVVV